MSANGFHQPCCCSALQVELLYRLVHQHRVHLPECRPRERLAGWAVSQVSNQGLHTQTHRKNTSPSTDSGLVFTSCSGFWWGLFLCPPAKEWGEREGAQWRYKEADWVSVWQHDRMHLSTSHRLLQCGHQTAASVWGGHPGEGSCSLGEGERWSGWVSLDSF